LGQISDMRDNFVFVGFAIALGVMPLALLAAPILK
jgi:hypothetical protein